MLKRTLVALSLFSASTAYATEVPPAMSQYIYDDLMTWVNDAQIVAAVRSQNEETSGLSESEIIARDNAWRAEIGQASRPTIDGVLQASLSDFLRDHQQKSGGRITEVFVMDGVGLNVAASDVTSDYWQGDEAKFQKTYAVGSGAVFIDGIELDESTQLYQGQVSFAVTDPANGEVVGAITIGLNASAFF